MKLKKVSFFIFIISVGIDVNAADDEDLAKCSQNFCVSGIVNRTDLTSNNNEFFQVTGEGSDAKLNVLKGFNLATSNKWFLVEIQTRDASKPAIYSGTQVPLCGVIEAPNADPYPIDRKLLLMLFSGYNGCSDEPKEYTVPTSFSGMFSLDIPICDEFKMIVKVSNDAQSETPDVTMTVNVKPDEALSCANGTSGSKTQNTDTVVVVKKVPIGGESNPGSGQEPTPVPEKETDPTEELISEIETNNGKGKCEGKDCVYGTVKRTVLFGSKNQFFKVTGKAPDKKLSVLQGFDNFGSNPQEVEITIESAEHPGRQLFWRWDGSLCPSQLDLETDPYPLQKKLMQMLFGQHKSCSDDRTAYPVPKGFTGWFTMDWEPKPKNSQLTVSVVSNGDDPMVEVRMKVDVTLGEPPVKKIPRIGVTGEISSDGKPMKSDVSVDEYGKCDKYFCIYGNVTRTALFPSDNKFIEVNGEGPSATISLSKPIDEYKIPDPMIQVFLVPADGAGEQQRLYSGINEVCSKLPKYTDPYLIWQQVIRMFFRDYDGCEVTQEKYSVSMGFAGLISFEKRPPCGEFDVILDIWSDTKKTSKITMIVKVVLDDMPDCQSKETTTPEPEPTTVSEEDTSTTEAPKQEITAADIAECEKRFCISGNATRIAFYSKDDDFVKVNGEGPNATFSLPKGIDEHGADPAVQVSLRTLDDMEHQQVITSKSNPFCIFLGTYKDPYLIDDKLVNMFFSEYDGCEVKKEEYSVPMGFSGLMSFKKPPPTCDEFQVILIIYNSRKPQSAVVMIVKIVPDNALGCLRGEPTTSEPESTSISEGVLTTESENGFELTTVSESPEDGSEPTTEPTTPELESSSAPEAVGTTSEPEDRSEPTTVSKTPEGGSGPTTISENPEGGSEPTPTPESDAEATAKPEPEITAADIAKCEKRFCISGTATRINLYSKNDDFIKVNGQGPNATFSLPKSLDDLGYDTAVEFSVAMPGDLAHRRRMDARSQKFCIFLSFYTDPFYIIDKLMNMFFSEYDGCEVKQKEYSVSTGFSGLMSFDKPPPSCDEFDAVLVIYNTHYPNYTAVMIVKIVPDNALGCLREEPTTSEPESTSISEGVLTTESENGFELTTVSESPEDGSEPTTEPTTPEPESSSAPEAVGTTSEPEDGSEPTTVSKTPEGGSGPTTISENPEGGSEPTPTPESDAEATAKPEPEITAADIAKCEKRFCISGTATRINLYSKNDDFIKVNGQGPNATFSLPKSLDDLGYDTAVEFSVAMPGDLAHRRRMDARSQKFCIFLSFYTDPFYIIDKLMNMFFSEYDGCEVKQKEYSVSTGFSGLMSFDKPPPSCDEFDAVLVIYNTHYPNYTAVMIVKIVPDNALGCLREEPTTSEPESTSISEGVLTTESENGFELTTVSENPESGSESTTTSESTERGSETPTTSKNLEVGSEPTTTSESPEVGSEATTTSESPGDGSEPTTTSESSEVGSGPTTTSESTESGSETTTTSESHEIGSEATTTSESSEGGSEPTTTSDNSEGGSGATTTSESSENASEPTPTSESNECGSGPTPMSEESEDESEPTTTPKSSGDKSEPIPQPKQNPNCTYFEWLKNLPSFIPEIQLYYKWLSDGQCVPALENEDDCSYFDWLRKYPSYIPSVPAYRQWKIFNNCESIGEDSGDSTESTCEKNCVYAMVTRTCLRTSKNDNFKVQGGGVKATLSLLPGFNDSSSYNITVYFKKIDESEPEEYQEYYKERISIDSLLADDARTKRPILTKILEMLFGQYEESSHKEKEYKVPMGFSGQFSLSIKPTYGVFDVLIKISKDPNASTADLTMTVEVDLSETDELGIKPNTESEPTSTPGPEQGAPNCNYFEWLRNLPSFIPDVRDYYSWLVGHGCVPQSNDIYDDENSTPQEEDSTDPTDSTCDYFVWLNNFPTYIPSVTAYRQWIKTNGCAHRETSIIERLFGKDSESDAESTNKENNECENGFCVFSTVTKTSLTTSDDNNIFKVDETGEGVILSLLPGFNDSASYTIEIDDRKRSESGESEDYQEYFKVRTPLTEALSEQAYNEHPIIGRMLGMLFGQYEESSHKKKRYMVSEGFSGNFLLNVKPRTGQFDVILKITQDPDSSTADLTMTLIVTQVETTHTSENKTEIVPGKSNCDYFQWLRDYPSFIPDVKDYFNWLITNDCMDSPERPKAELADCDYFEWLRNYPTYMPSADDYRKWVESQGCIFREITGIDNLIGNDSANAVESGGSNDSGQTGNSGDDPSSPISGRNSDGEDADNSSDSGTESESGSRAESNDENTTSGSAGNDETKSDCNLIQTVISYLPFTSNCDSGTNDSNDSTNSAAEQGSSSTENSGTDLGQTETTSNCNIIQTAISFLPFTSNDCNSETNDSNDGASSAGEDSGNADPGNAGGSDGSRGQDGPGQGADSTTANSGTSSGQTETTSNCNLIQTAISFLPFTSNDCNSGTNDSNNGAGAGSGSGDVTSD